MPSSRSLSLFAVGCLAMCALFVSIPVGPAAAAAPTVRVVSSLVTVQPLDAVTGAQSASLTALRGEAESFQVVVGGNGGAALQGVDLTLSSPLRTTTGAQLPDRSTTISLEQYSRVWTPSDQEGVDNDPSLPARQRGWCQHFQSFAMPDPSTCGIPTSYSTDGTPFNNQWKCGGAVAPVIDARRCLFPDALIPRVDPFVGQRRSAFPFSVPAGENRVAWIDVLVPPDATAGTYTGTVRVTATGMDAVDVPVTVLVKPVRLPASGEAPSLDLEAGVRAGADVGPSFCQAQGCGTTLDTNYRMQSLFVRSALENRLPLTNLPGRENPYASHRTVFDKWITPYLTGAGPTTTIDGVLPSRLPTARNRNILLDHNVDQEGWTVWTQTLRSSGTQAALGFYCDEVLQDPTLFANQCSDPYDTRGATGWTAGGGTGVLPSFLIGNQGQYATAHARGRVVTTNARTLVPNTMFHLHRRGTTNTRPEYDTGFLAGRPDRRLWGYDSNNALGAGSDWTTSSAYNGYPAIGGVDQPATSERAGGLVAWSYRLSGHFYYSSMHRFGHAWNDCSTSPTACLYDNFGGHGDGTLYYPGPTSRVGGTDPIPVESMRLKRFRDGSEDYTTLRLLETGCAGFGSCTTRSRAELLAIVGGPELAETTGAVSRPWRTSIGATAYDQTRASLLALFPNPPPPGPGPLDSSGRIAFSSNRDGDFEIFTMDALGGSVAQLTTTAAADQFPAWSPDGRRIAWTRGGDIWVMDASGANATNLTGDVAGNASKPAWSADGSTLVYVYGTAGAPTDLHKMSATGASKTPLVTYATGGISSYDPAVSPAGVVLFSQDAGGGQQPGLFRIDLNGGGGFARVTTGVDEVVDVGPDGARMTFSRSATGATPYDVFTANLNGSATSNVTAAAAGGAALNDFQSSYSPDGQALVLTTAVGGDLELWVVAADGTTSRTLTANTATDADADWAPDAAVNLTPEALDTNSTTDPFRATITAPFRNLLAVEPSSVRIVRIDGRDVSGDVRFVATSWSVTAGVGTATFDRSSLNAYLKSQNALNRPVLVTVRGTAGDTTWTIEATDTIRPK